MGMTRGDPFARLDILEGFLHRPEFVEGIFGKAAIALDKVAHIAAQEAAVLGDEVTRIDTESKLPFERLGETGNHEEGRVHLPIDEARDARRADSRVSCEPRYAFEGEAVVVRKHIGKPVDGRSENR